MKSRISRLRSMLFSYLTPIPPATQSRMLICIDVENREKRKIAIDRSNTKGSELPKKRVRCNTRPQARSMAPNERAVLRGIGPSQDDDFNPLEEQIRAAADPCEERRWSNRLEVKSIPDYGDSTSTVRFLHLIATSSPLLVLTLDI